VEEGTLHPNPIFEASNDDIIFRTSLGIINQGNRYFAQSSWPHLRRPPEADLDLLLAAHGHQSHRQDGGQRELLQHDSA
jgi:hypothetical protein